VRHPALSGHPVTTVDGASEPVRALLPSGQRGPFVFRNSTPAAHRWGRGESRRCGHRLPCVDRLEDEPFPLVRPRQRRDRVGRRMSVAGSVPLARDQQPLRIQGRFGESCAAVAQQSGAPVRRRAQRAEPTGTTTRQLPGHDLLGDLEPHRGPRGQCGQFPDRRRGGAERRPCEPLTQNRKPLVEKTGRSPDIGPDDGPHGVYLLHPPLGAIGACQSRHGRLPDLVVTRSGGSAVTRPADVARNHDSGQTWDRECDVEG